MKASFSWAARREGNTGIVRETRPDGSTHDTEMPSHLVPAFIRARRQYVHYRMEKIGGKLDLNTEQDWTFMADEGNPQ